MHITRGIIIAAATAAALSGLALPAFAAPLPVSPIIPIVPAGPAAPAKPAAPAEQAPPAELSKQECVDGGGTAEATTSSVTCEGGEHDGEAVVDDV